MPPRLRENTSVLIPLGVLASGALAWLVWTTSMLADIRERVAKIEGRMEARAALPADADDRVVRK